MWDPNCFLAQEAKRYTGRIRAAEPETAARGKKKSGASGRVSHRTKQTPKRSTGGKAPNVTKKLAAAAARAGRR